MQHTIVLGGGIAGLAIAKELLAHGEKVTVLEKATEVGGLARTLSFDGYRFDIGGHRFHSNNPDVVNWVKTLLGDDLIDVPRESHIRLDNKYIEYPIRFPSALGIFSPLTAAKVIASYVLAQFIPKTRPDVSFEDWVVRRFGRKLYNVYFKPYTEKIWGIKCTELSAMWASQRISLPSLVGTIRHAILPGKITPKTVISRFFYPKMGFSMIVEALRAEIEAKGGQVVTGANIDVIDPDAIKVCYSRDGEPVEITGTRIISSIPLSLLFRAMPPSTSAAEFSQQHSLAYRDIILVDLAINRKQVTNDSWTYFPDPKLIFGRTHEPKNWSDKLIPSPDVTSLAVEIFSSRGETVWQMTDDAIIDKVVEQMDEIGLISRSEFIKGWVVRVPFAYPIYYIGYEDEMKKVHSFLEKWPKLHLVGRTGAFKYMNSDGVIEDVFRLMRELYPQDRPAVAPLKEETERWA
jgi:protoporphyrinogen oxidase